LLCAVLFYSCKKSPVDGVSIVINPSVMNYTMALSIADAFDGVTRPKNINVSFSGPDAQYIYESGGTKKFIVQNGILGIGLAPTRVPAVGSPVKFNVTISANGYLPVTQQLTISNTQKSQITYIKLINLSKPPAGTQIAQQNVALSGGAVAQATSFDIFEDKVNVINSAGGKTLDETSTNDGQTSVVLPAGTTFHYYVYQQTGTATGTSITPQYENVNIPLDTGNGTATYRRLVKNDTIQYSYPVFSLVQKAVASDSVKIVVSYQSGQDLPYSIYPYNYYTPISLKLLNGTTTTEDQLLYKTAVSKKLLSVTFLANVNSTPVEVTPDAQYQWYTSLVLNPATINPVTNLPIAPGDSLDAGIDAYHQVILHSVVSQVTLADGTTQLRATSQSPDVGYYYKAPYETAYNYTFDTTNPFSVADPDNLSAAGYVTVLTGSAQIPAYVSMPLNTGLVTFNGVARSFNPIQLQAGAAVYYWGQGSATAPTTATSGGISLAGATIQKQPTVTFNVSDVCTAKNKTELGYGYAYINGSDGKLGFANMVNGVWATNGMTQGQTYYATIYAAGGSAYWYDEINKYVYTQVFQNKFNVCDDF
jgi:hypothetical protein